MVLQYVKKQTNKHNNQTTTKRNTDIFHHAAMHAQESGLGDSVVRQCDCKNAYILLVVSVVATHHETKRRRFSSIRQLQTPFPAENRKGWRAETEKKLKRRNDTSLHDRRGRAPSSLLWSGMQNPALSYLKVVVLSFNCMQEGRLALEFVKAATLSLHVADKKVKIFYLGVFFKFSCKSFMTIWWVV